jgi:transposase
MSAFTIISPEHYQEVCGLKRSLPQGKKFKKNGFKPLKVGFLPAKADSAKQKAFAEDKLKPQIKPAKEGFIELFFMEASHFVMGGFMGTLWIRVRCFVKTACRRSRYNVPVALNFCGKKVTTVTNDTYISAEQAVMLMTRLLAEYKDKTLAPVLDNAAYQRCGKVTDFAKEHGIGLIFLPPYSANLNLIERFWKPVKSKVLNAAYHGTFEDFKRAIDDCVSGSNSTYKKELDSLVQTPGFLSVSVYSRWGLIPRRLRRLESATPTKNGSKPHI